MKTVYMFPGQGAQKVGMGKELYESFETARRVIDAAEQACNIPLKKLCFEGPNEELSLTNNSQPALLATSMAALEVAREHNIPEPQFTIGLSLGEYTALCAAGVLSLEDAVRLVHLRGTAMQEAAEQNPGSMTSLLGANEDQALELVDKASAHGVIGIANLNCPGQIVISGQTSALDVADELAKQLPRVRVIRLNVSGAFHSPLMQPAADRLRKALEEVTWHEPCCPIIQNFNYSPVTDVNELRENLVKQLTGSVQFEKSLKLLIAEGVDNWFELGSGNVLAGLLRRTDRSLTCKGIGTSEDLASLA